MDEDRWIEEAIEEELNKISLSQTDIDELETELEEEDLCETEPVSEELPDSVVHCLEIVKNRVQSAEELILEDVEDNELYESFAVVPCSASDYYAKLASVYNEDVETLKKRILAEIEKEEEEEEESQPSSPLQSDVISTDQDPSIHTCTSSAESNRIGNGEVAITTEYSEEERYRQELQLWEEHLKEQEEKKMCELRAQKELRHKQKQEEEERRKLRQQQFEEEKRRLEQEKMQQQTELEDYMKKEQDAFQEEQKQHEELMLKLQLKIEEERRLFEEHVRREEKRVEELQNKAATKIQAKFREFMVRKKFTPILKERKEERLRQEELQRKMERERREKEARMKRKLEEQKQKEKEERKRQEEAERLEKEKQERRRIEYEKKKQEEKLRVEKEKQLKLEQEKQKEKERKQKEELERKAKEEEQKRIEEMKKEEEKEKYRLEEMEMNKQQKETVGIKMENSQTTNVTVKPDEANTEMVLSKMENDQNKCSSQKINKTDLEEHISDRSEDAPLNASESITIPNELSLDCQYTPKCANRDNQACITSTTEDKTERDHLGGLEFQSNNLLQDVNENLPTNVIPNLDSVVQAKTNALQNDELTKSPSSTDWLSHQLTLPAHIEEKRLTWIKTCIPWSKVSMENKRKKVPKRRRPHKSSASQLPPLSAQAILQTDFCSALDQVTTVTLQDLPGCSLSSLSQCPRLKSLTLRRCGLAALNGISNCQELKYIDVQENRIHMLNCRDLENLYVLLLSKNQLSSIHGLEGCINLRTLELSYNNVTRIGGLESLKNLQRLVMDHNQLITTKGLCETPTLMHLDCSFNHLSSIEGIENCGLLQTLMLQGNNLTELPCLVNHVLLRELHLDDNSISSLKTLTLCWLPLLELLSVSQSSLTQLAPLADVLSLEKLNISKNCLSETDSILSWLDGCERLKELSLDGNPVQQESNWKTCILSALPGLEVLNGERVSSTADSQTAGSCKPPPGSFLALCQAQHEDLELLRRRHDVELNSVQSSLSAIETQVCHFEELMKLSEEHRYAHEYGDMSIIDRDEPEAPRNLFKQTTSDSHHRNNLFITGAKENKQDPVNIPERLISPGHVNSTGLSSTVDQIEGNQRHRGQEASEHCNKNIGESEDNLFHQSNTESEHSKQHCKALEPISASTVGKHLQRSQQNSLENFAATVIQAHWRGYAIRRDIHLCASQHKVATLLQAAQRGLSEQQRSQDIHHESSGKSTGELRHSAATTIQAAWKGFLLRKKLACALAAVEKDEPEDDFEEVNLDDFTYDEASLEKEWLTLESARSTSAAVLASSQLPRSKHLSQVDVTDYNLARLPWQPQQAWQAHDNTPAVSPEHQSPSRRTQHSTRPHSRTQSRLSEMTLNTGHPFQSEKEEKISKEWGFMNMHTAQLMLKRAQKMTSKKAVAKKLLDPAVRLALFKNNKNKHPPVELPRKVQSERVSYFKAQEDFARQDSTPLEHLERRKQLTYQWLHTQVGEHETVSSNIVKSNRFLPELDPEVLNGGRVQLVASPVSRDVMDLDVVSVCSGSALTQASEKNNQNCRHSAGHARKELPVPVKANSAPSKKERLSFRDKPVQLSAGWGSGKKRGKHFK
nr:PREDICTED: leucine-rich repeat and IQ domain-containing protein 1 isoform X2 [Latimeria chalumnae]|eukprot:XP_014349539.1 PREDICTED: leucine-rich repeat and IQ domain-containing protein 1 isoform X2 [Latimeria chalumnae]